MAKDVKPDEGEANLEDATSGKTGLGDINPEQLAYLGGELDPIDTEDFSKQDDGSDFVPDSDEEVHREIAAKAEAAAKEKEEAEAKDKEKDDDKSDDDDKDKGDADDADADADDAEDKGDSDEPVDADEKTGDADDSKDEADEKSDADEKADEEADEPVKKAKAKEQTIPKSRFDEVNARRRDAELKLKNLEAEKAAKDEPDFDFDKAEISYMDLLLSGKTDQALAKRNEIRAAEQAAYAQYAGTTAVSASDAAQEQVVIAAMITRYEADYLGFNPESDEYSEDLMDEVSGMFIGYQSLGFKNPEAFKMALDNVVKIYDLEKASDGESTTTEIDEATGKSKTGKVKTVKKPIKKTKEKLAAAKKQPADPGAAGGGSDDDPTQAFRIEDMSDEEIEALPPATLARLRGDTVD